MPKITINEREINAKPGDTILRAAERAGIEIPHFCYHPELQYVGSCRMCMVEVAKAPKLMTACSTMVTDQMIVNTESEKVKKARAAVLEFLLLNHPLDCPICDKAGECPLQDNYFKYSAKDSRFEEKKWNKKKAIDLGPTIVHDQERCILCTRCVRFMQDVAKSPQLIVAKRGSKNTLTTYPGESFDSPYSLNAVDICPVGALTSKDFRFKCRAWYLKSSKSICPFCSTGCNTIIQHKDEVIYRILPERNDDINGPFMCDHGRLSKNIVHSKDRIFEPVINTRNAEKKEKVAYEKAFAETASKLSAIVRKHGTASIGVILSPYLSIEEAYLSARLFTECINTPNFSVLNYEGGFDEFKFHDNYLISKDKSPNMAGVLEVLKKMGKSPVSFDTVEKISAAGRLNAIVFIGPSAGCDEFFETHRDMFAKCNSIISITTHERGIALSSDVLIPLLMWAETSGHFLNSKNILQKYNQAVSPENPNAMSNVEMLCALTSACGLKTHYSSANSVFDHIVSRLEIFKKGDKQK